MHHDFTVDFEKLDQIAADLRDEVCMDDWNDVVDMVHGVQELDKIKPQDQTQEMEDRLNTWLKFIMHICNHFQIYDEPDPEGPLLLAGCCVLLSKTHRNTFF